MCNAHWGGGHIFAKRNFPNGIHSGYPRDFKLHVLTRDHFISDDIRTSLVATMNASRFTP